MSWVSFGFGLLGALLVALPAAAHPEFQKFSQQVSGRFTDCALCHLHPEGPEGVKPGQIGSLDAGELTRLGQARAAFAPGGTVDSPVLNRFGNSILRQLGKTRVLELRRTPAKLAQALDRSRDLDGDGIGDVEELLDGTHPLDEQHGAPAKLLRNNLIRQAFPVLMTLLATLLGLWGLNNLLAWMAGSPATDPRSAGGDS